MNHDQLQPSSSSGNPSSSLPSTSTLNPSSSHAQIATASSATDSLPRPPPSPFEELLASSDLPPPGPDHYAARRALWWSSPLNKEDPRPANIPPRLAAFLNQEGALENDQLWKNGLEKLWKVLMSGNRLKTSIPLHLAVRRFRMICACQIDLIILRDPCLQVRVVQAGWVRDGTWPQGGVAPEPDDILELVQDSRYVYPPLATGPHSEYVESVPSPQTTEAATSFPPSITPTDMSMEEGMEGDG